MAQTHAKATILKAIRDHGALSRTAVARRTGLGMSTVSTVTKALVGLALVEELGTRQEKLGRPSILLAVNPRFAYTVGGNVSADSLTMVLVDLMGSVLAQGSADLFADPSPAGVTAAYAGLVDDLTRRAEIDRERLAGAGLALSGLVDAQRGICLQSTVLGWERVAIADMLEAAIGLPVALENDANAVAIGEKLFGKDQEMKNFAVVSVGRGIGAGLFVDGRLYRGRFGVAGELGHCTVVPDGPVCACGKRGCLEAVASVPAVLEQARASGLEVRDFDELETLAASDGAAAALLARAGQAVGLALSHLVNLFSPELIILTGSGAKLGDRFQAAVRACLDGHVLPLLPQAPRLVVRHEDEAVWARGAASLASQAFFEGGGDRPSPPQAFGRRPPNP